MIIEGRVWRFGDNITTDAIIPAHRKQEHRDMVAMARFLFEEMRPGLTSEISPGDLVVAGVNFGCGSSREAAAAILKAAGVGGILAKSFGRIFFRNAVNVGLAVLALDTDGIAEGARLRVDFRTGKVQVLGTGEERWGKPLPRFLLEVAEAGGLLTYLKVHGDYRLSG